jgi:hypothetical protein
MKRGQPNLLILGLAIGFCLAFGLAWLLDGDVASVLAKKPWEPLTLPITLFVGVLAYIGIQAQIKQQYNIAEKQRQNQLKAARAVLPLVLSSLHALCKVGFSLQPRVSDLRQNPDEAKASIERLSVTSDQIQTIKECIEFGDDASSAWLSLILAHFQIEVSRLNGLVFGASHTGHIIESSQVDWEVIASMIDHLFDFSRTGSPPGETLKLTAGLKFNLLRPPTWEFGEAFAHRRDRYEATGGLTYSAFIKRLTDR